MRGTCSKPLLKESVGIVAEEEAVVLTGSGRRPPALAAAAVPRVKCPHLCGRHERAGGPSFSPKLRQVEKVERSGNKLRIAPGERCMHMCLVKISGWSKCPNQPSNTFKSFRFFVLPLLEVFRRLCWNERFSSNQLPDTIFVVSEPVQCSQWVGDTPCSDTIDCTW